MANPHLEFTVHFSDEIGPDRYINKAKRLVRNKVENRIAGPSGEVKDFDVYVVWFAKVLQNWKALVSTSIEDGMYYEVTYDGDKGCAYIDSYPKSNNEVVWDDLNAERRANGQALADELFSDEESEARRQALEERGNSPW